MADTYRRYPFVSRHRSDANFISGCLRLQLIAMPGLGVAIASLGILNLYADKLLAATWSKEEFRSQELGVRSQKPEARIVQAKSIQEKKIKEINIDTQTSCKLNSPSSCILTPDFLKPKPFLIAAPENFNPGMRIPPPPPPKPKPLENSSPKPTSTQPVKPIAVLENIQTDYRYDTDNFGQRNLFIEPTAEFRLSNGNKIKLKTGFDYFEQRNVESITNIPLQVGWSGKVGQVTLQTAAGIDVFDRLPTAVNLNAKVEALFCHVDDFCKAFEAQWHKQ